MRVFNRPTAVRIGVSVGDSDVGFPSSVPIHEPSTSLVLADVLCALHSRSDALVDEWDGSSSTGEKSLRAGASRLIKRNDLLRDSYRRVFFSRSIERKT